MTTGTAKYDFNEDFKTKIIALLARNQSFITKTEGLISPDYFESEVDKALVSLILDYFKTFKTCPSLAALKNVIVTAVHSKSIRKDMVGPIRDQILEIYKADLSDAPYIESVVVDFAKHQALNNAILDAVAALDRGDYPKIERLIRDALNVGVNEGSKGYRYWDEIEERTKKRVELLAGTILHDGITTGFEELDKYLYHKGWGRKELAVIMGAAKAGKSMSLGDFAKNASLAGFSVLYVTLEVACDIIAERTDANVADVIMRQVKDNPHSVKAAVEAASRKANRNYIMHEYASGTFKASQLRRLLETYRSIGIEFDLVVVDYADIMAPERFTGDLKEDMRMIYLELRAIAFDYNCAMLTATQTNREGAKSIVAKMTDVAEDFNKIRTADLVLSINATEDEKKAGEARIFFAAARNSESDITILVKQDRERMKFITKVVGRV